MGQKTKIDWCDSTWNPVTGCQHNCEYCYARGIAKRFGWHANEPDINERVLYEIPVSGGRKVPYPFDFQPTFHRYKLDEPQRWKEPRNIFVVSMGDLFGDWVPDEWIDDVIKATQRALQHRYLFLTKNPERYVEWLERFEEGRIDGLTEIENCWFGASATNNKQLQRAYDSRAIWVSIEPIHEKLDTDIFFMDERNDSYGYREFGRWKWVVIGAETGNLKNKIMPKKSWVQDIAEVCESYGTPVFMKESLRSLMGDDFRQEFPWEDTNHV